LLNGGFEFISGKIYKNHYIYFVKNKRKILLLFLVTVLLADCSYSFLQYLNTPLDGDIASLVLPTHEHQKTLNDPFGLKTIINNKPHTNPNRFFVHWAIKEYFQNVPILLQKVINPIQSIYFSSALIKIIIHLLMIYLLAVFINKGKFFFNYKLIIITLLLAPLFQAYGYHNYLGFIDTSITYTFFYALPLMVLLFFYSFLYRLTSSPQTKKLSLISIITITVLVIVLPFSGPLIPPVIIIVSALLFGHYLLVSFSQHKNISLMKIALHAYKNIPRTIKIAFISISILSLYSLFLGSYNSGFQTNNISIYERLSRLPLGVYYQFTQKLGFPILFFSIALNSYIIKKHFYNNEGKKIVKNLKWILIFSLIYILLLPFGGFRFYRENILRYDTIMPITIAFIYLFGATSYFLLTNLKAKKNIYLLFLIAFFLIFTNADRSTLNENKKEKKALTKIQNSTQIIVSLKNKTTVFSWNVITDYNESDLNAQLMHRWNITSKKTLYYFDTTKTPSTHHKPVLQVSP